MSATAKLAVSAGLALPADEAQTQTIVVYGGKGMGKTNFGAVLAEELARHRLRFAWIDPVGVAWGLKHSADGRGAGVPILMLGGVHGDLPIMPTAGAVVADLVVDEDASVVVDISRHADGRMWGSGEKIRFVRDYFVRLFERQGERRRPLMQILDEAGRFVPQQMPKGAIDIAECVGAIEQLVELGRNVGVGVTLITQRSARMNKSVSELAEMMIAFRTVGPRSIESIVDWFAEHKRIVRAELENQLRALPRGTALIVSPGWLGVEGEYQIRKRDTFDSSETPVAGKERRPRGRGATVDLDHYRQRMAETIEAAEDRDPRALKRKISELEQRLRQQKPADAEAKTVTVEVPVEVPVLTPGEVEKLDQALRGMKTIAGDLGDVTERILSGGERIIDAAASITEALHQQPPQVRPTAKASAAAATPKPQPRRAPAAAQAPSPVASDADRSIADLSGPEQRVLDAIAYYESLGIDRPTKPQVGMVAGYRVGKKVGGTYGNILGQLRSRELIDYPSAGDVSLTETGRALAQAPDLGSTNEDVQRVIFARLNGPEQRVLQNLVDRYPEQVDKLELAPLSGYQVSGKVGGTYGNILGRLHSLGLIDYPRPGLAVAADVLFPLTGA